MALVYSYRNLKNIQEEWMLNISPIQWHAHFFAPLFRMSREYVGQNYLNSFVLGKKPSRFIIQERNIEGSCWKWIITSSLCFGKLMNHKTRFKASVHTWFQAQKKKMLTFHQAYSNAGICQFKQITQSKSSFQD